MTEQQLHKNQFDFYLKDDDWSGRIVEDNYETVHYQKTLPSASGSMNRHIISTLIGTMLWKSLCL